MTIRQRINERLRQRNKKSLESSLVLFRNSYALPSQSVFLQSIKASAFDEGQVASVPKQILQIRGDMTFDVQAGDTFQYNGQQWQVTDESLEANSSVAIRVMARRMQ